MQTVFFSTGDARVVFSEKLDGNAVSAFDAYRMNRSSTLWKGFSASLELDDFECFRASQIHSDVVVSVKQIKDAHPGSLGADALITQSLGEVASVVIADCVPIGLYSRDKNVGAAVHAGWKGIRSGIVEAAIASLRSQYDVYEIESIVGPHICVDCYEFKGEAAGEVKGQFGEEVFVGPDRSYLDLSACLKQIFDSEGVVLTYSEKDCTLCSGRFFSYRGGDTTERNIFGVRVGRG